jgi:hypothetical protein
VRRFGGSGGNEQLTAIVAALLVPLLLAETATLLNVRSLLTVHAFIGMLLVPLVAVKLASAGWRMARYYAGRDEYVRRGPPQLAIRLVVAPVLVASTIVLFGTGVALLALGQTQGSLVGLHKASFVVWFVSTSVHVLARLARMSQALRARYPGIGLRLGLVAVTLVAGSAVATMTLAGADQLQDRMSTQVGLDGS